jgi:hypothetical protein
MSILYIEQILLLLITTFVTTVVIIGKLMKLYNFFRNNGTFNNKDSQLLILALIGNIISTRIFNYIVLINP